MSELVAHSWLGLVEYSHGLLLQQEIVDHKYNHPYVLGLEHPAVITMGKRAREEHDLNTSKEELKAKSIDLVYVDRGGEATLHSPGQLVIYPMTPIQQLNISVKNFVELLMCTTESFLNLFGVETLRKAEPGLFTKKGKICFLGLRIKAGVSMHGLSINLSNDLELFKNIRSCGVENENFDSLSNYSPKMTTEEAFLAWLKIFQKQVLDLL